MKNKKSLCLMALLLTVWLFCLPLTAYAAIEQPRAPLSGLSKQNPDLAKPSGITKQLPTGNVNIIVNDGTIPVSGTTVSVTVNGTPQTAATDTAGKATFNKLPVGSYVFSAEKAGYASATINIKVTNGATASGVISLARQTGDVAITVNDGTNPVSGATVQTVVSGSTRVVTTDSAGKASFNNLPPGNYTFTATKTGYNSGTTSIAVTIAAKSTSVISMARQYGSATITVIDPGNSSAPISGAAVSVTVDGAVRTVITDSSGKAIFNNMPAGSNHAFSVTKTGYASNSSSKNVWIDNGKNTAATIWMFNQNYTSYTVYGVVIDAGYGTVLKGATVKLGTAYTATTASTGNNQGAYQIEGVAPGTYQISVTYPGYHLTFTECGTQGIVVNGNQITIAGRFSNTVHLTFRMYKN